MPYSFHREASSLAESKIFLNQSFLSQNITTRQVFPRMYKKEIWIQIARQKSRQFITGQEKVLNLLINNEEKFSQYFKTFYNNHLAVYEWFVLATQKHLEIKEYVFSKLLKKTFAQYKSLLKQNMSKMTSKHNPKKQTNKFPPNLLLRSPSHSKKSSFQQQKKPQTAPNSFHQSALFSRQQHQQTQDYHELFIKTLDACDGFKYIHYDFCRHQKGYENRNLYNRFIRGKGRKNSWERLNTFYEEMEESKEKKENLRVRTSNGKVNLFNKTLQFLKPAVVHNAEKCSKFEIIPFQNHSDVSTTPSTSEGEGRKVHLKKNSKTHVMKMMPHRFGKQKPSSAFTIKLHKPPVIQPMRT